MHRSFGEASDIMHCYVRVWSEINARLFLQTGGGRKNKRGCVYFRPVCYISPAGDLLYFVILLIYKTLFYTTTETNGHNWLFMTHPIIHLKELLWQIPKWLTIIPLILGLVAWLWRGRAEISWNQSLPLHKIFFPWGVYLMERQWLNSKDLFADFLILMYVLCTGPDQYFSCGLHQMKCLTPMMRSCHESYLRLVCSGNWTLLEALVLNDANQWHLVYWG